MDPFFCRDGFSPILKGKSDLNNTEKEGDKTPDISEPPMSTCGSTTTGGGTRAGLFRTPISGGVQSATSAHGLPRPALAVRNLMEQVWLLPCFQNHIMITTMLTLNFLRC